MPVAFILGVMKNNSEVIYVSTGILALQFAIAILSVNWRIVNLMPLQYLLYKCGGAEGIFKCLGDK